MKLEIPAEDREILTKWLTAEGSDAPVDQIINSLTSATPALRAKALARSIESKGPTALSELEDVLFLFFNLARTAARLDDDDRKEPAATLARAVLGEVYDADKRLRFEQRVSRILGCKSVQITAKALNVLRDDANSFCEARALSQIRPVFGEDGALEPEASVIVHQLKIVFHAGPDGDRKEIFVSMDRRDLEKLQRVLTRALSKDEKLRGTADKLGLPVLAGE